MNPVGSFLVNGIKKKAVKTILDPLNEIVDQNLMDITTTIGSFIVRKVRGQFQRSITFTIGNNYTDRWMEAALYGIIYKYNDLKKTSRLEIGNDGTGTNGSSMYFRLDDGTHNLKYRKWNILLCIQTPNSNASIPTRQGYRRVYTIITYDMSPEFTEAFEKDMLDNRNSLLKIRSDRTSIAIYNDGHENDGYTYWDKLYDIPRRKLNTIYLPYEQKKLLVDTINAWHANKKWYNDHGIPHNLTILLYGPPGPQPVSLEIPTPNGPRKMGDIKPGDFVYAYNGLPTKVIEVYEYDKLDVYEITFNDGRKTLCGADHKWPTISSRGNIVEKSTIEMMEHGVMNDDRSCFKIPLGCEVYHDKKSLPIDPWALGVLIGDGCLTGEYLQMSSPDGIIPRYVSYAINADFKRNSPTGSNYTWTFYNKDTGKPIKVSEFLADIPEIATYSRDKIIPEMYKYASIDDRYALLQGLMDTDGSISETDSTNGEYKRYNLSYSTTSRQLASDILSIIRSLGFTASISEDHRTDKYISGYCATISIYCNDVDKYLFFRYSHKVDRAFKARFRKANRKFNKHPIIAITNIEKLNYQEDMRCLHVEDRMHLYLTNDYIVTCNSGKTSITKMIASEWNRNIYECTGGKDGKFIPQCITNYGEDSNKPLYSISDIDKYPFLINEQNISMDGEKDNEKANSEQMQYKQLFGAMINALDGITSGEDRLIVMTTNNIDKFSEVLLRPGRVHLKMEIGYVVPEVFRKFVFDYYGKELPKDIELSRDDITISELQSAFIYNKMTFDEFIKTYTK